MLAVWSRLITIVWCIISGWIIPDHEAQGVETLLIEYSSQLSATLLSPFVKWDAIHFLKVASEGFQKEHQLVFFPLYPFLMRLVGRIVDSTPLATHFTHLESIIVGSLVMNIAAFVAALMILKRLLPRIASGASKDVAELALLMFMFNPAGIFFTSIYTESMFALLSWTGFHLFANDYDLLSAVPFLVASLLRSNGSLNIIVVALTYLQRTRAGVVLNSCRLLIVSLAIVGPGILLNVVHLQLLCGTSHTERFLNPTVTKFLVNLLYNSTIDIVTIGTDADTARFCARSGTSLFPPIIYTYLQKKYWNVGFLKCFQFRQIPNFLLALPIVYIATYTLIYSQTVFGDDRTDRQNAKMQLTWVKARNSATLSRMIDFVRFQLRRPEMPYVLHLAALLIVGTLFAHVQITTRLICAASPILYVGMAHLVLRQNNHWIYLYIEIYNVIGVLLHCNYFPWT